MERLVWVNAESTVLVERVPGTTQVWVAMRPDSDAVWGPPIGCEADRETTKVLAVGAEAARAVERQFEAN